MPRPVRPWFRFYTETPRDPKVRRLTPTQRWIWTCLMSAARESPEPGKLFIAAGLAMTHAELAELAAVKEKEIPPALDLMQQMGMVHLEDGVIVASNFVRRQYESDTSAKRTRDYRERHRDDGSDAVVTSLPSHNGRHSDGPETETETETEKTSTPRDRGTKLPKEWTPALELIEWQRENNIADALARRELPKFRDYWAAQPGQRGVKADWPATWRNWLRTAQERESPTPNAARIIARAHDPLGSAR